MAFELRERASGSIEFFFSEFDALERALTIAGEHADCAMEPWALFEIDSGCSEDAREVAAGRALLERARRARAMLAPTASRQQPEG